MSNLLTCPDCQHQVSTTAKACPNCGNKKIKQQIAKKQWAEMDPKKKKKIYIGAGIFFCIYLIAIWILEPGGYSYSNGIGTITHYTAKDYNRNSMLKKMGEEVWALCKDHPEVKKINLIIVDECKDSKGNIEEYSQTITFKRKSINEFLEYQTASSFNQNCYEFGLGLLEWKPCGNSQF